MRVPAARVQPALTVSLVAVFMLGINPDVIRTVSVISSPKSVSAQLSRATLSDDRAPSHFFWRRTGTKIFPEQGPK